MNVASFEPFNIRWFLGWISKLHPQIDLINLGADYFGAPADITSHNLPIKARKWHNSCIRYSFSIRSRRWPHAVKSLSTGSAAAGMPSDASHKYTRVIHHEHNTHVQMSKPVAGINRLLLRTVAGKVLVYRREARHQHCNRTCTTHTYFKCFIPCLSLTLTPPPLTFLLLSSFYALVKSQFPLRDARECLRGMCAQGDA